MTERVSKKQPDMPKRHEKSRKRKKLRNLDQRAHEDERRVEIENGGRTAVLKGERPAQEAATTVENAALNVTAEITTAESLIRDARCATDRPATLHVT